MKIAIMLRALDEKGGIGVYSRNLLDELLAVDDKNHYVLFYRNREHLGRHGHCPNVTERFLAAPNKLFWDQIAVPYACWREKVDVVFHPKFTAPLLAPCPAVMVVHGADWLIPEQALFYGRFNVWAMRLTLPLYFRKCTRVISVSQLTTDNFNRLLKLPPDKLQTVYFGPARHFRRETGPAVLERVRQRYQLPEKFILTLTKLAGGDERKNFGRVLQAYARYHRQAPGAHKLVVGGKDCHHLRQRYAIPDDGYGRDVLFPGWIDQADLPAVYSLADLYLYPSNLEAFPIPLTEAMACGTPIVTSDANGLEEIAADAALLVDPQDDAAIAAAICRVLSDRALRADLSARGLARSGRFNWRRCAQEITGILNHLA
jgi:glycosyltransferase involved in cell wall biosynthesis